MSAQAKIDVGVLGATGAVGQQFVALLARHPWFRVAWLAASEKSAGQRYGERAWRLSAPLPEELARMNVEEPIPGRGPRLVFSALDAAVAGEVETSFAASGHIVVSNARNHRMDAHVPLLVPEINPEHLALIHRQRKAKGWSGAIVTNPNCSTVFLALVLDALRKFGPERVLVTTMQALSGAGYPGVASLDAVGNVIPFIAGEEEKVETETLKILGHLNGASVVPMAMAISATTSRVPVLDGHTEVVSVALRDAPPPLEVVKAFNEYSARPQELRLPSAPERPIVYLPEENRPQPRLDVGRNGGMTVFVGRLRPCPVLGYKFVALGHNTIRGAAGAAILNAELMSAEGLLN